MAPCNANVLLLIHLHALAPYAISITSTKRMLTKSLTSTCDLWQALAVQLINRCLNNSQPSAAGLVRRQHKQGRTVAGKPLHACSLGVLQAVCLIEAARARWRMHVVDSAGLLAPQGEVADIVPWSES